MDGIIQMLPSWLRPFSTYIDFEGQRVSERIFQVKFALSKEWFFLRLSS
jgi:hypothetical protein